RGEPPGEHPPERDRCALEERPETVAREVEREHAARERGRRHDGDPRRAKDLEPALGEDRAPLGRREEEHPATATVVERDRRPATDDVAEESELAEDEEDRARLERRGHREERQEIR